MQVSLAVLYSYLVGLSSSKFHGVSFLDTRKTLGDLSTAFACIDHITLHLISFASRFCSLNRTC